MFGPPFDPVELASPHHAASELCERRHHPARHEAKKGIDALDRPRRGRLAPLSAGRPTSADTPSNQKAHAVGARLDEELPTDQMTSSGLPNRQNEIAERLDGGHQEGVPGAWERGHDIPCGEMLKFGMTSVALGWPSLSIES
jgi:hypothetical protein